MIFYGNHFSHPDVFGHLKEAVFSAQDAAAYLEISLTTLRRYVNTKKIKPTKIIDRRPLFSAQDLRQFKQNMA